MEKYIVIFRFKMFVIIYMTLNHVDVNYILDNGHNQQVWENLTIEFISKIQARHKLSNDEIQLLKKMLMDKKVLSQAIGDFKIIYNAGQGGGGKKKSRRRKKKKRAKKTKRRYRRGMAGGNDSLGVFFMLGIMGVVFTLGLAAAVVAAAGRECSRNLGR